MITTTQSPRRIAALLFAAAVLLLAGCATRAPITSSVDGPEARPAPNLMQVPDAQPVLEPIRPGGPNKPYAVLGETYQPLPAEAPLSEQGLASWYGRKFHGRRTASGELYNMYAMSAAHRTLPLPSYVRVSNPANGRMVIVRVNDRGPFIKGRIIDLSYTAALKLGALGGVTAVQVERITPEDIRRSAWQAPAPVARVIDGDEPPTLPTANPRGIWIQLGAFRDRLAAEQLQSQASAMVEGISPMVAVLNEQSLYRVQAGPFATRDEALRAAERVRDKLPLLPVVVDRR